VQPVSDQLCGVLGVAAIIVVWLGMMYVATNGEFFRPQRGTTPARPRKVQPIDFAPQYPDNWPQLRQTVLTRDGNRCGNCGSTSNLMVHHIVPLSRGGTNQVSNLRTLCEDCHKKLHPHMR
jgi:hypothetical protein